jgi:hypothetical protein
MFLIVDIDHTISDANWRNDLLDAAQISFATVDKTSNAFDRYHEASIKDKPIEEMILLVNTLHKAGWAVIGLTTRPEKWRNLTNTWMITHGAHFDVLLMRPNDDYRPAAQSKLATLKDWLQYSSVALKKENTIIVLDDREDIREAFRAEGFTVLQVFA